MQQRYILPILPSIRSSVRRHRSPVTRMHTYHLHNLHIYTDICVYTCAYTYLFIYIYICIYVCIYIYTHMYAHAARYIYIYIYIYIYVCMYVGAVTSRSLYPGREGGGLPSFVYTGMCKYVLFSLNKNVWNCIQVYWINHLHDSVSRGLGPSIWSKLLLFRFRHSTQTQKVKRCLLVGPKDYLNLSWSISTWCGGMSDAELSSIQSSIACMCKYVHVYTRDMWISLYIYIYIYICIHMQKDVYIHTRRPIYTYMCIYTHENCDLVISIEKHREWAVISSSMPSRALSLRKQREELRFHHTYVYIYIIHTCTHIKEGERKRERERERERWGLWPLDLAIQKQSKGAAIPSSIQHISLRKQRERLRSHHTYVCIHIYIYIYI